MLYHTQILKGIFRPQFTLYQLQKAETTTGIGRRITLLYFLSLLLFAASTYFGIGTETFSGFITERTEDEFEASKIFLLGGKLVFSLLQTSFYLWFLALIFWLFLDIPYSKGIIVQLFILTIHLIEKLITYPILILLNLNQSSNPFSLGVISQYLIKNEYWIHFFGSITLFQVLAITMLFYYLSKLTEKKNIQTLIIVISVYLLIWLFQAFVMYIEVPILLRKWLF